MRYAEPGAAAPSARVALYAALGRVRHSFARHLPRRILRYYQAVVYAGFARRCPLCNGSYRIFLPAGLRGRPDACCPGCGSLERHRIAWLYLTRLTDFLSRPVRLLHIAPEPCIEGRIRACENIDYLSGDFEEGKAMVRMDITCIDYPDESFDVIYCSHVLEHVVDDTRAMRELHRVLRPGGTAVIQVPVADCAATYEDSRISTPERRLAAFGQSDHVRVYGHDVQARLSDAGFTVEVIDLRSVCSRAEIQRWGVDVDEPLFVCGTRDDMMTHSPHALRHVRSHP